VSLSPKVSALPGYRVELSPERLEPIQALPRDVQFRLDNVLPAPLIYLGPNDRLWIRAYNSVAGAEVEVRGRILLPGGALFDFSAKLAPSSDRIANDQTLDFRLPRDVNGFFLEHLLVVRSAGSFRRGQFFVQVAVFRGSGQSGFRHQVLASGYVGFDLALAWPGTGVLSPLEGPGALVSVAGSDPAAGAEISETVPAHARWRLQGISFALATSAVVAGRIVSVLIDDGASEFMRISNSSTQGASATFRYTVGAFGNNVSIAGSNTVVLMMPPDLFLFQGWRVRTLTTLLDAGDNFGPPQLCVEEWIED